MRKAAASAAKLLRSHGALEVAFCQRGFPGPQCYRPWPSSCTAWKPDFAGTLASSRGVTTTIRIICEGKFPSNCNPVIIRQSRRECGASTPWQVGPPGPGTLVDTARVFTCCALQPGGHRVLPDMRRLVATTDATTARRHMRPATPPSRVLLPPLVRGLSTPLAPPPQAAPKAAQETTQEDVSARRARLAAAAGREGASQRSTLALYLAALVVAMVGLTYASVPLYRLFCQATGFGGTIQKKQTVEERIASEGKAGAGDAAGTAKTRLQRNMRDITVYFVANVADNMPWKFVPCQRAVTVKPNESTLAFYNATNLSDQDVNGVSTYNVSPMKAGQYFTKIQCFCFEEQRLLAGESVDMPVFFYIDPDFASDPKMDDVHDITLSYTFFRVEPEDDA
eukprot:jgi/Mesvir1/23984/Mv10744-RA.1